MDRKRTAKLVTVLVMAVLVLLFGVMILSDTLKSRRGTGIVLPDAGAVATAGGSGESGDPEPELYREVSVTPENVGRVIATLSRPAAYTLSAQITYSHAGASASAQVIRAVREGAESVTWVRPDGESRILRSGGLLYAWEEGRDVLISPDGAMPADAAAGMPEYETAAGGTDVHVTQAGYTLYEGFSCIFFVAEDDSGLVSEYYVDIDTGLLVRSENRLNGETVYVMQTLSIEQAEPDPALFRLPDGTVPGE